MITACILLVLVHNMYKIAWLVLTDCMPSGLKVGEVLSTLGSRLFIFIEYNVQ